jgi:nucleotide-binding universal stress UspA family protein
MRFPDAPFWVPLAAVSESTTQEPARGREDQRPAARVVVATDGGPAARAAALHAARLLRHPLAVTLVTVIVDPPGEEDAGGIEGPVATPEEEAREWERDEREAREALRVTSWAFDHEATPATDTVDKRVEIGDAGHAICIAAEDVNADLIVMGIRGRGRIQALLFGSTTEYVIRHAKCPVLLAHDPED